MANGGRFGAVFGPCQLVAVTGAVVTTRKFAVTAITIKTIQMVVFRLILDIDIILFLINIYNPHFMG